MTAEETTREQILQLRKEIGDLVITHVVSDMDSLLHAVLQAGLSFDESSRDSQEALFAVASQRAKLVSLLERIVETNL